MPKGTQHSYNYIYNMIYITVKTCRKLTIHNTTPNSTIPLVSTSQISTQPRGLARKILQRIQCSYIYIYTHIYKRKMIEVTLNTSVTNFTIAINSRSYEIEIATTNICSLPSHKDPRERWSLSARNVSM